MISAPVRYIESALILSTFRRHYIALLRLYETGAGGLLCSKWNLPSPPTSAKVMVEAVVWLDGLASSFAILLRPGMRSELVTMPAGVSAISLMSRFVSTSLSEEPLD